MLKNSFILFLVILLAMPHLNAQETPPGQDTLVPVPDLIPPSEIPTEITKISKHLVDINNIISPRDNIMDIDSIVRYYQTLLKKDHEEIISNVPTLTYRTLENLIREWENYKNKFTSMQKTVKSRVSDLESVVSELNSEIKRWQISSEYLKAQGIPEEVRQASDTVINILGTTIEEALKRSDSLLVLQRRETRLMVIINETIRILEEEQVIVQESYFIIDSKPIWHGADSTTNLQTVRSQIRKEFNENLRILNIYLSSNRAIVILQLVFIIALIAGFIILSRMWPTNELDPDSRRETQAGVVIRRPFLSSLILSIIFSVFFYTNRPLIFVEFFLVLMMISAVMLLPGLISNKIKIPLLLLLAIYIISLVQNFLPYQSFANRIIIIIQCLSNLYLLFILYKLKDDFGLKPRGIRFYSSFLKVLGVLIIVAFITNIVGSVKLSGFLVESVIDTLILGVIVLTIVIILNSMLVLLVKGKQAHSIPQFEQLKIIVDKRIKPLIDWSGFIFWIIVSLKSFGLLKYIQKWVNTVMDSGFEIASVSISVGGVISFILIILFTFILARFVKNVFKDELITKSKLPRGTASALSMLLRYIIVALGIYLALTSVGVNMNKFGFMAGALGVGIGFGLQNVVLNFIAGLILAFEQPIHIGDVIEVDQYMGRVTEIGVRASKILTWDGSEVIVPNGLLISNNVVNWTLTDQKRRLVIPIRTAFDADPKKVIEILKSAAANHPNTFNHPAPMTLFNGYGDSSLDFTLYCWVEFDVSLSTKSDIAVSAHEALAAAGIPVPLPVQKLQIGHDDGKHPAEE